MRRSVIGCWLLACMLICISLVSGVEVNAEDSFIQDSMFFAKIDGTFVTTLELENIVFYRGHVKVPIVKDIARFDDSYYVYASLIDKTPGNYSMVIEDVEYKSGRDILDSDIIEEFIITNESSSFTIDRGFVYTNDRFYFTIENLKDSKSTIYFNTIGVEESADDDDSIVVSESDSSPTFFDLLFGEDTSSTKSDDDDSEVSGQYKFELRANEKEKIFFNVPHITKETRKTISLESGNTRYVIPLFLYENEKASGDNVIIDEDNETVVDENESEDDETSVNDTETGGNETHVPETSLTCAELNGSICGTYEVCEGKNIKSKDALCCIGVCEKIEKSGR